MKKKIVDNIPTEDTTPVIINSTKLLSLTTGTGESLGTSPPREMISTDNSYIIIVVHTLPDKVTVV